MRIEQLKGLKSTTNDTVLEFFRFTDVVVMKYFKRTRLDF